MLAKGLEPSTVRLQGGCSTIELHQQKKVVLITKDFFLLKSHVQLDPLNCLLTRWLLR